MVLPLLLPGCNEPTEEPVSYTITLSDNQLNLRPRAFLYTDGYGRAGVDGSCGVDFKQP